MNAAPTPLAGLIADEIAASGPMTVARFMELALGHPEYGYYRTRDPLGRSGDFITAPEVSQMFGELIGLWAAVTWEQMGRPEMFVLAEMGPGRGTLMHDALRAARAMPGFIEAARLHLLETSPVLRAAQGEALAAHAPIWIERIEDLPPGPAIVIANEFFDALPIRQFLRRPDGWFERLVTTDDGAFGFTRANEVANEPGLPPAAPEGAIVEKNEAATEIMHTLANRLVQDGGAGLIIDYGHSGGVGDTLQAVRNHRHANPLDAPGEADLTAHVDFSQLARAAHKAQARTFGPMGQGPFLLSIGIAHRAERLAAGKDRQTREAIEAATRRLIARSEMGTLFKAFAVTAPSLAAPPGFENA
jgi:NADH dehydrogenase [ubiquinone] 1 alpha subcomplex assembly factor 7